jgi:hypothetical protein
VEKVGYVVGKERIKLAFFCPVVIVYRSYTLLIAGGAVVNCV